MNLKVNIKDRNPPCILHFHYLGKTKNDSTNKGDLFVYVSKICKDPNEENNQGKYINVRWICISLFI